VGRCGIRLCRAARLLRRHGHGRRHHGSPGRPAGDRRRERRQQGRGQSRLRGERPVCGASAGRCGLHDVAPGVRRDDPDHRVAVGVDRGRDRRARAGDSHDLHARNRGHHVRRHRSDGFHRLHGRRLGRRRRDRSHRGREPWSLFLRREVACRGGGGSARPPRLQLGDRAAERHVRRGRSGNRAHLRHRGRAGCRARCGDRRRSGLGLDRSGGDDRDGLDLQRHRRDADGAGRQRRDARVAPRQRARGPGNQRQRQRLGHPSGGRR
jgi:hypothetical protein